MKVIFDANILISFLLTRGETISKILNYWQENKFEVVATDEILIEIKLVLERFVAAKLIIKGSALALLERLEREAEIFPSFSIVTISPNKKDNRYLAAAKDGKADYLVTGDKKHLLSLKQFEQTKIISPSEFIEILAKNSD